MTKELICRWLEIDPAHWDWHEDRQEWVLFTQNSSQSKEVALHFGMLAGLSNPPRIDPKSTANVNFMLGQGAFGKPPGAEPFHILTVEFTDNEPGGVRGYWMYVASNHGFLVSEIERIGGIVRPSAAKFGVFDTRKPQN